MRKGYVVYSIAVALVLASWLVNAATTVTIDFPRGSFCSITLKHWTRLPWRLISSMSLTREISGRFNPLRWRNCQH